MIRRLKTFIHYTSLTDRAFAQKCGIAQNTMSYYLSEQRKPSFEAVEKILQSFPELSAEWLIRGEGEMLKLEISSKELERINKLTNVAESLQEVIDAKNQTIATLTERIKQLENQIGK